MGAHHGRVTDASAELPSVDRLVYLIEGDLLQDDDIGLWEIVWTLNRLAPAATVAEKVRLARRAVSRLVGRCELWRGEWPGGPVALLTEDERNTLAHEDTPWHDPEHATLLVWVREEGAPAE